MARRQSDAKRSQWADRLRKQVTSGLSIAAFCRKHSISEARFYYWKRRLKNPEPSSNAKRRSPRSDTPRFVQLHGASVSLTPCVEISVPSGALIRIPADNVAAIEAAVGVVATPSARSREDVVDV